MKLYLKLNPQMLDEVKEILEREGYYDTFWQIPEGVFGLVKDLPRGLQIHIKAYSDGTITSEIEIQRWYLEHLFGGSCPATEVLEILDRYGIEYQIISLPQGCDIKVKPLIPWILLLFGLLLLRK